MTGCVHSNLSRWQLHLIMMSRGILCMLRGRYYYVDAPQHSTIRTVALPGWRSLHFSPLLGRRGTTRQRPLSDEERLPHLRSAEKRVAVFAGVSLIVGYIALKTAFSHMASKQPRPPPARPLVVAGPSGSGKSTLLKKLFLDFPDHFGFSISHTTRKPRPGEVDGRDYHFTTREQMRKDIEKGEFIEWAEFSGNMYGTSKKAVADVQRSGKVCVLDIDMQGVRSMKKTNLNPVFIFVKPPSVTELERRLRERKTETEENIQWRVRIASEELEYAKTPGTFDHVIVNDIIDVAYKELKEAVTKEVGMLQNGRT